MILERLKIPVVLAPLAGGPSTPELAAAVTNAGGLGFVAGGYLTAGELADRLRAARTLSGGDIGANLFAPGPPTDPAGYRPFVNRLSAWAERERVPLGDPRHSDDDWDAKIELLVREPVALVSFTFGCPPRTVIDSLRGAGSEIWVTVTSPQEALQAEDAGADVLVVQGSEAGGHRGSFVDRPDLPLYGLLPLLALVARASGLPRVASGGISDGPSLAAALAAGAAAAQIGTAFMLCPEAGTSEAHRQALLSSRETALTRAFTGRLARGIRNRFLDEHTTAAPIAYPELHYLTSPMRGHARQQGNDELVNLWAGEAHALATQAPAGELARRLASDAQQALRVATVRASAATAGSPTGPVSQAGLQALARLWFEAWHAHDLDQVLSHYADDVVFTSPFVAELGADDSGTIYGKDNLRSYWNRALERFPDLRFEPLGAFFAPASVVLHYRSVQDLTAVEFMEVGPDGLVRRATAHYDRTP